MASMMAEWPIWKNPSIPRRPRPMVPVDEAMSWETLHRVHVTLNAVRYALTLIFIALDARAYFCRDVCRLQRDRMGSVPRPDHSRVIATGRAPSAVVFVCVYATDA